MDAITSPTLERKDIALRPISFSDIEPWYAYLSIPGAVEHTSWSIKSREDVRAIVERCHSSGARSLIRFAVVDVETARMIGSVGFHTISAENRTAEIAFDLHPEFWGQGIATHCCRAALTWGFAQRQYVRIQATALDTNYASMRVLEKSGFALEGLLRNFRLVRGVPRDFRMYSSVND
jgi:RimJ/RimL family protein N-acetyltransferase